VTEEQDPLKDPAYLRQLGQERMMQIQHYVARLLGTVPFPGNVDRAKFNILFLFNDGTNMGIDMEGNAADVLLEVPPASPAPPPAPPPSLSPAFWFLLLPVAVSAIVLGIYVSGVPQLSLRPEAEGVPFKLYPRPAWVIYLAGLLAGSLLHALARAIMLQRAARSVARKAGGPSGPGTVN